MQSPTGNLSPVCFPTLGHKRWRKRLRGACHVLEHLDIYNDEGCDSLPCVSAQHCEYTVAMRHQTQLGSGPFPKLHWLARMGHSNEAICACCSLADKQHTSDKEASFQAAKQFIAAVSAPAPSIDLVAIAPAPVDLTTDVSEAPAPAGPELPGAPFYNPCPMLMQCPPSAPGVKQVCQATTQTGRR